MAPNATSESRPTFAELCPVIDAIADPDAMFEALRTRGYCWVLNSGITDADVAKVCQLSQQFWSLDRQRKLVFRQGQDVTFSGYVPWGVHRPTANTPKELLKETLYDFKEAFDLLHPDNEFCTIPDYEESREFFHEAVELMKAMSLFGRKVVEVCAEGMKRHGKDGDRLLPCFEQLGKPDNMTYARVAYYPGSAKRQGVKDIEFGKNTNRIGIHRDSAPFVAQIASPDIRGLQLEDHEYGWYDVEPLAKDALWLHVGQLGYHITDGVLQRPLLHKVALPDAPDTPDRYCIVNFLTADRNGIVPPMSRGEGSDLRLWTGLDWVKRALVKAKDTYGDMKPNSGKENQVNGSSANGVANGIQSSKDERNGCVERKMNGQTNGCTIVANGAA